MKKIININLSGRVIPIEDSAYEKLQGYIESLRRYFANEESRDEIINDIESRIAELLHEKIRKGAAAVTDADVDEVIASMGTVADFEAEDKETVASTTASSSSQSTGDTDHTYARRERRRLYRDSGDKMIGGVCSGIAYYLGIDPAIVRILFAIISFGGFGLGFLAYIILWIVLPPKDLEGFSGKRLYRNPDDKVISGVAGGLAAYFDRSSSTIRLIFAAPIVLNIIFGVLSWPFFHEGSIVPNIVFGSLTGTFILAYIVLWIVLPEANSEYQKMEMRGEKVDVNRIRLIVREGVDSMKERMKGWTEEVKESAQSFGTKAKEFAGTRGRAFAAEANEAARRGGRGIGHIIGVLFKAFFLFIAGTIAFALFVGLIGVLIGGVSVWPLKNFIIDGFWQNLYGWGTLVLFLGVPLVGFIVWLLRRIMKVKSQHNYLGWTFGGLWAIGWVCVTLFVASLVNDFRMSNYKRPSSEVTITQPAHAKMIVKVSEPEVEYSGSMPWVDIDGEGLDITKDTLKIANVKIEDVLLSTDSNYHVEIKKYSRGRTVADAESKAQKLQFNISYNDSVLDLGSNIAIDKETKFRGQQVIVIIRVPAGKKIRFDETVEKLHSFNITINERNRWDRTGGRDWDIDDESFGYKLNVDYTMGADGQLKDPTGAAKITPRNNDYRYQDTDSEGIRNQQNDIQQRIEIEKQKKEESDRIIKDLEEKQKKVQTKTTGFNSNKINKKEERGVATGPSPVSSLTEWF
ncbi:MAG: PspC domain-containing protein [Ferruginibacter sp.]|nr:PspC domain-containing protein [Chitinophagaceae bacterium]